MKMGKSKLLLLMLGVSILATAAENNQKKTETQAQPAMEAKKEVKIEPSNKTSEGYNLKFDANKNYTVKTAEINGKTITYRAYENIVYVKNPVDVNYQTINIYIPEEYFKGQSIGKYNEKTAPLFFPNSVGGYMPGAAGKPEIDKRTGKENASLVALSRGCIVAAPGARGRTLKDEQGNYTGKAPAAIVDLKAAVRYLRSNDKNMPGNAERIISNGTSAGGALSALLGATGNNKDYEPYLKELGAADAKDDIFVVSAYCPITNLNHANEAYEWMFGDVKTYKKIQITMLDYNVERKYTEGTMTEDEISRSADLKKMFPSFVNSLKLNDKK